MSKIYNVDVITKLVSDIVSSSGVMPDDIVDQCKSLLSGQVKNMQDARELLAQEKLTPAMRKAVASFMKSLQPLFDVVLPKDPAVRQSYQTILKSLSEADQEHFVDLELDHLQKQISTLSAQNPKNKIIAMVCGMVAVNVTILLLVLFGNQSEKTVGEYMIISESVLLAIMLQSHASSMPIVRPNN
jgi:hypothetical protein